MLETDPVRLKAGMDFLAYRVGKEEPINMRDVFGDRYDEWEVGRGDGFLRLFPKFPNLGYYTGKDYGAVPHTEILSSGLELLATSPARFLADDEEYFKFIIRVLRREL